jgi:hypothetical protein
MRPLPILAACGLAAAAAGAAALVASCSLSSSTPQQALVRVSPILDSVFVGDSLAPLSVTYFNPDGTQGDPGPVRWSITPDTIARIDSLRGVIHGLKHGVALAKAAARGDTGLALVTVSRRLDLTLLLDTVYLLPNDTITLPLAVVQKSSATSYTRWFTRSPDPARYTIDTAAGLVTAVGPGNPLSYVAHVAAGPDTVADTGAVAVVSLADTSGGRFFVTVLGTAIRHEGGAAFSLNYTKTNGARAFRLVDSLFTSSNVYEQVFVTLVDSIIGTGTFLIDSLSPGEANASLGPLDAVCRPLRPWASWASTFFGSGIRGFSHRPAALQPAGSLTVTQYRTIAPGHVIGGRYLFTAQRSDLYFDPLGALTVRGIFVAPLVSRSTSCQ